MKNRLSGDPYEYIDKIMQTLPEKLETREINQIEHFWETQSQSHAFSLHSDAYQSILYKPGNT